MTRAGAQLSEDRCAGAVLLPGGPAAGVQGGLPQPEQPAPPGCTPGGCRSHSCIVGLEQLQRVLQGPCQLRCRPGKRRDMEPPASLTVLLTLCCCSASCLSSKFHTLWEQCWMCRDVPAMHRPCTGYTWAMHRLDTGHTQPDHTNTVGLRAQITVKPHGYSQKHSPDHSWTTLTQPDSQLRSQLDHTDTVSVDQPRSIGL